MSRYITLPWVVRSESPAASLAMRYALFHWGFHQWANFAIVGLAIAYVRFRMQRPGLISETFRSSIGHHVDGGIGHGINILAVVSTVFGVATTLGLGVIQINSGLVYVGDIGFGADQQLFILGLIAVVFLLCALVPLESGVRYVSDANMALAAFLLIYVFFFGPTDFITAAMTNAIGDYFANVMGMSLVMTPYWRRLGRALDHILLGMGTFLGSIFRQFHRTNLQGRTIREFRPRRDWNTCTTEYFVVSTFGGSTLLRTL